MKYIRKKSEPEDFKKWRDDAINLHGEISYERRDPKHNWAALKSTLPKELIEGVNYYTNQQLWAELLQEQGHICAYCGRRLTDKVRIDHLNPKSIHKERVLDYSNLLAVCDGSQGQGLINEHCDVKKGDLEISVQPTSEDCENRFSYVEGEMEGIDGDGEKTIKLLGLNVKHLKEGRKNISKAVAETKLEIWMELYGDDIDTIRDLKNKSIDDIYNKIELNEFCFVEVFYLNSLPI